MATSDKLPTYTDIWAGQNLSPDEMRIRLYAKHGVYPVAHKGKRKAAKKAKGKRK
jgi:hypothetical protein